MVTTVHLRGKPLQFHYLVPQVVDIINTAAIWSHRSGQTVYLTSIDDHQHGPGSLHAGYAVDLDVAETNGNAKLTQFLKDHLGPGFDVIDEGNHVHAEFDLAKHWRRP